MAISSESKTLIESSYLTKGTIGNVGMPGAPIVYFSLIVSPEEHTVSGIVEIIQSVDRPTVKVNVTGNIRQTGYGDVTMIVNLMGEYIVSVPPPAIGSYLQKFTAYMDVNNNWNGIGGFTYSTQRVDNVPVKSVH